MDSEGAGSREVRLSPGKQACHFLLLLVILHCSWWIPHLLRWEALAVSAPPPPPLPPACPSLHIHFPPGSSNQLTLSEQPRGGNNVHRSGKKKKTEKSRRPVDRGLVGLEHIRNYFFQATHMPMWTEVKKKKLHTHMGVEDLPDRMMKIYVGKALIPFYYVITWKFL